MPCRIGILAWDYGVGDDGGGQHFVAYYRLFHCQLHDEAVRQQKNQRKEALIVAAADGRFKGCRKRQVGGKDLIKKTQIPR